MTACTQAHKYRDETCMCPINIAWGGALQATKGVTKHGIELCAEYRLKKELHFVCLSLCLSAPKRFRAHNAIKHEWMKQVQSSDQQSARLLTAQTASHRIATKKFNLIIFHQKWPYTKLHTCLLSHHLLLH
mmetsp:Transcript_11423/g.27612  ORF Transcript_11423/g.27612 Transcript_11423/m.27612 type:complete len:131 (-) Transcript_11423:147-539(-)